MTPETWALVEMIAAKVARGEVAIRTRQRRYDGADFDDFAQEARIAMWHAFPKYQQAKGPLDRFLMTAAKHRLSDLRRLSWMRRGDPESAEEARSLEHEPEQLNAVIDTDVVLADMPTRHRDIFRMRLQGFTLRDCAAQFGLSAMSVHDAEAKAVETIRWRFAA